MSITGDSEEVTQVVSEISDMVTAPILMIDPSLILTPVVLDAIVVFTFSEDAIATVSAPF